MKYLGMPAGMWALFSVSFRRKLTTVLGYEGAAAARITEKAHREYRALIKKLPTFEKDDRFQMNIVSCAMLSAFVLKMPKRPDVDELTRYYASAMMIEPMRWFCRMSGKRLFSPRGVEGMKATAVPPQEILKYRHWEWTQGVGLYGLWRLYEKTGEQKYMELLTALYDQ